MSMYPKYNVRVLIRVLLINRTVRHSLYMHTLVHIEELMRLLYKKLWESFLFRFVTEIHKLNFFIRYNKFSQKQK